MAGESVSSATSNDFKRLETVEGRGGEGRHGHERVIILRLRMADPSNICILRLQTAYRRSRPCHARLRCASLRPILSSVNCSNAMVRARIEYRHPLSDSLTYIHSRLLSNAMLPQTTFTGRHMARRSTDRSC